MLDKTKYLFVPACLALVWIFSSTASAEKLAVKESNLLPPPRAPGWVKSLGAKANTPESKDSSSPAGQSSSEVLAVDFKYDDPSKGFLIQLPSDWAVQKDYAGYAVFAEPKVKNEPTSENPVVADPTLTVAVIRNPMPIDKQSLEDFAKEMEDKFKETNGAGSEMQIFQKNIVDNLPGGKTGLLYYLTYKKNSYDVVSAVLVRSNSTAMYRVTLTDYKVGFDKTLERLYPIMASINITGDPIVRENPWELPLKIAVALGSLVLIFVGFTVVSNRKSSRILSEVSDMDPVYDNNSKIASSSIVPLDEELEQPIRKQKKEKLDSAVDFDDTPAFESPPAFNNPPGKPPVPRPSSSVAFSSGFNAVESRAMSKPLSESFPFDDEMMEENDRKTKKDKGKKEIPKKVSKGGQPSFDDDDFPLSEIGIGKG